MSKDLYKILFNYCLKYFGENSRSILTNSTLRTQFEQLNENLLEIIIECTANSLYLKETNHMNDML